MCLPHAWSKPILKLLQVHRGLWGADKLHTVFAWNFWRISSTAGSWRTWRTRARAQGWRIPKEKAQRVHQAVLHVFDLWWERIHFIRSISHYKAEDQELFHQERWNNPSLKEKQGRAQEAGLLGHYNMLLNILRNSFELRPWRNVSIRHSRTSLPIEEALVPDTAASCSRS